MRWSNKGNQFKTLGEHFKKRNKLWIYGAWIYGEIALKEILPPFLLPAFDGFVDRNKEKQANGFCGYRVHDAGELFERHDEEHLIVVALIDDTAKAVMDRLDRAGYVRGWDYFHFRDVIWDDLRGLNHPFLPVFAFYAMNKIYLSSGCFIPSRRCNLNCKECLNFNPYLTDFHERDLSDACEDVDILFHAVDYMARFQISGGEPLLYPYFKELAEYIGKYYRKQIGVYSTIFNGTVIPTDDVCETMRRYDMTIYLDDYTQAIPSSMNRREEIVSRLDMHSIHWIDNAVEEWFSLNIESTDNSFMPDKQLTEYFDVCNNPWHQYEYGRMYSCNFARYATVAHLNQEEENDYFDLRTMTEENRVELLEFSLGYTRKGYVEFCKRCAGWGPSNHCPVPVAEQAPRTVRKAGTMMQG